MIEQKIALADAQLAGVVLSRNFVILRYITHQKRILRQATTALHGRRKQISAAVVLSKFKRNAQASVELKEMTTRAVVFRESRLMEKACVGLIENKFSRERKREMSVKARQYHAMCLVVNHFNALKERVEQKAILNEKREIMHQVIQTLDIENLKQRAFDAIFQNLVTESEEQMSAAEQLNLGKKRRLFRVLHLHKDYRRLLKSAE